LDNLVHIKNWNKRGYICNVNNSTTFSGELLEQEEFPNQMIDALDIII
jgi:hypothetical protein